MGPRSLCFLSRACVREQSANQTSLRIRRPLRQTAWSVSGREPLEVGWGQVDLVLKLWPMVADTNKSIPAKRSRETMKKFACGDVVPGCDAVFTCSSDDEMLQAVAAHAAEVHAISVLPQSLVDQVIGSMQTVA